MISGPLPDQQNLHNYKLIKDQIKLPLKIHLYFTFLEAALENHEPLKNNNSSQAFSPLFYSVFYQLSSSEKAYYLHSNISFLKKQYNKFLAETSSISYPVNNGNNLTASGQISETIMGLTYWGKLKISFTFESKQVKLETKNRNFCIDLRLYLIRKSKKYKSTLVLEAISDIVTAKDRKLSLFFKENIFDQIYQELLSCIMTYRNQELFKIALEESTAHYQLSPDVSYIGNKSKSLNFLSSKNINDFLNFKDMVVKKILKADFNFENIFNDNCCKIGLDHNRNRKNNIYKMEATFEMSVDTLKKLFLQKYKSQSFKHIIQSQDLEKFSQKYSAVYQKLLFEKEETFHEIEQIIVESINDKETLCENEELIFQKGVHSIKINSFIEFLMVQVKRFGESNKSQLIVVASFNEVINNETNGSNYIVQIQENQQAIIMFLLEFYQIVNRKEVGIGEIQKMLKELRSFDGCSAQKESKEAAMNDFITVQGNFINNDQDELVLDTDDLDTVEDNGDEIKMDVKQIQDKNFKKGTLSFDSKTLKNCKAPILSTKESEIKT